VNTGKFTGQGGNLEETVTRNNLEAAEEIVRQLRLRDVGGIVVIDFIDMVLESNRELVLRRLLECLARDRTKHQVAEVTSLGLVQMTRKRVGAGLLEAFSVPCECCNGRGVIITFDPEADAQASHHVHSRGAGNGGNGSRGSGAGGPASPATVAARARQDGHQAGDGSADDPQPDGSQANGQHADGLQEETAPAVAAEASGGPAEPSRSGSGRRRRRRPSASAAAGSATTAGSASAPGAATTAGSASAAGTATASATTAASAAPEAPQAPEAPAAATAPPEPTQAQDGAA
jgi:ribonuclease E